MTVMNEHPEWQRHSIELNDAEQVMIFPFPVATGKGGVNPPGRRQVCKMAGKRVAVESFQLSWMR